MKHSPFKIGSLGVAFLVLFLFSVGFADDFSDFEKLLQEAMRTNQNGTVPSPSAKEARPAPSPGTPVKIATTKPIAPNSATAANARKTSPEIIDDGWTTVQPNAPGIVMPEPKVVLPPQVKAPLHGPQMESFGELAPSTESGELEEEVSEKPQALFEPDPISAEKEKSPAAGPNPEPLFLDNIFEEEYTIIEDAEEINAIESKSKDESESKEFAASDVFGDVDELETISEPKKRVPGDTKESSPSTDPAQHDDLSTMLEDLANEKFEESSKERSNEVSEGPVDVTETTRVTVVIPDFDRDDDEAAWKMIDRSLVGDPFAQDKLKLMYDEVINGLQTRNITGRYDMWKKFSKGVLRDTAGINTSSELDGRCRLKWYEQLYGEPVRSTFEVEEYSRELFVGLSGGHRHLTEVMPGIRERMDIPKREDGGIKFPMCTTPQEAIVEVKRCLLAASSAHASAFSTLTGAELLELQKKFVETFVGKGCVSGHTIPARSVGRKHVDIMDRVNKAALYDGAEALLPLTNRALLDLLMQLPEDALPNVMLNGQRAQRYTTAAGDIIIGGRGGRNVYDLDSPEMRDVICVISRGDDDTFREGVCNMNRPVLVVIAMGKKNTFVGANPGIQGGSIMGISMLLDLAEQSTYSAVDVAQGSTMGGVGILINYEGTNSYKGQRRVQGHALLGLGMLIDRGKGNAAYKASLWSQGFGAPGGFGVLANSGGGNNHYYCGGYYPDSYPEHPGYDGWGQGVGAGIRQVANGGIGVILSGGGNDVYEVDYFGQGGGYWLGVGIARDFGGNDIRYGTTTTTYDGRPRPGPGVQARWTRFANGWGCHYALGYLFDDGGNDVYGGQIMGTGMAWDLSYGILCDFSGNGQYTATGNMTQGVGAEASIGILFSYGGNDIFASRSQGLASGSVTYHPPAAGGNFSFLINYGGENTYGSKAARHSYVQRGTPSGFLIDRPTEKEAAVAIVALQEAIKTRNQEIEEYDTMVAQKREEARQNRRQYRPPRRPVPISETQLIGAVPDFDANYRRAEASETNVK